MSKRTERHEFTTLSKLQLHHQLVELNERITSSAILSQPVYLLKLEATESKPHILETTLLLAPLYAGT